MAVALVYRRRRRRRTCCRRRISNIYSKEEEVALYLLSHIASNMVSDGRRQDIGNLGKRYYP